MTYNPQVPYLRVRAQRGHSLTLHLIFGVFALWINVLVISLSKNHYWHV